MSHWLTPVEDVDYPFPESAQIGVDADGQIWGRRRYEGQWQRFWSTGNVGVREFPSRLRCDCGSMGFRLVYPQPYQLNAICVSCGAEEEVYSG